MKGIGRIVLEEGCALPQFRGNSVLRIDNYRRNSKTNSLSLRISWIHFFRLLFLLLPTLLYLQTSF